ncbi:hypothetical protein ACT4S5_03870 [Kocuria oceani]|uniref:hypothetical protein n=1 Tax=Kocuria oceani TaxID=988827 RepID=UPI004036A9BF
MTVHAVQPARSTGPTIEAPRPTRLLVSRQDPVSRRYYAVGFLSEAEDHRFRFDYLEAAVKAPGFRPLPGLSRSDKCYVSDRLFPLFAERIMSSRRPDREIALSALGLGLDAAPFEVLARGGGRRVGDTIELTPAPEPDTTGTMTMPFLVHGLRYLDDKSAAAVEHLTPDAQLALVPEPDNKVNEKALVVADVAGQKLGYVPDPLLNVIRQMSDLRIEVARVNPLSLGFHLRLLVIAHGRLGPHTRAFEGPEWQTVWSG